MPGDHNQDPSRAPEEATVEIRAMRGGGQAPVAVRGSLVRGLSQADVKRLDAFEGDETAVAHHVEAHFTDDAQ